MCCGTETAVQELLVAEPVPEFAFEGAYGHQVLRGAGVFVRVLASRGSSRAV